MRFIIFIFIFYIVASLTKIEANQRLSFPLVYRWSKRIKDSKVILEFFY